VRSLQWGHDEGVVEGDYSAPLVQASVPASMGPRRRRRGRHDATALHPWGGYRFNGATTKASWKAEITVSVDAKAITLQWGHDEGVVEGDRQSRGAESPLGSFNGATTKASWKAPRPPRPPT